jgi:membrane protein
MPLDQVQESIARIRALMLDPPAEPLRRRVSWPLYVLRVAAQLGRQWAANKCPQIAASLAFQTVLSLVPIMAVTSALLTATGALRAESALTRLLSEHVFPAVGPDLFEHLMSFVDNVRKGALGPFGLAFTLLLAYTVYHSADKVFSQIWRAPNRRPLVGKFIVFYMLATLVPFLLGLSLYQTARYWNLAGRGAFVSGASIWLALLLANKLLPQVHVRWRAAALGATVSAILFEGAKITFTKYLTTVALTKYEGVYGGLAIIPITLAWLYLAWLVVLFGAECAHAAQNLRALERRARGEARDRPFGFLALRLVVALAERFCAGGLALPESELASRFELDVDVVARIVARLKSFGLLVEVEGEAEGLLLAMPAAALPLERVLAAFTPADVPGAERSSRLGELLGTLEQNERETLGRLTVADLLEPQNQ